jgi:murein L,D-transpeptidase YcbB/YkuD
MYLFLLLQILLLCQCGFSEPPDESIAKRDRTITKENASTTFFLDSNYLEDFIHNTKPDQRIAERMRKFYGSRNYQFAWFGDEGLTEQAQYFWNLHNRYLNITRDSSLFDKELHKTMETVLDEESEFKPDSNETKKIEVELTQHFFDYAKYAYTGRLKPEELQWHIPKKKIDAVSLLDSLVRTKGDDLNKWEPPVSLQYQLLQKQVMNLYRIEKSNQWKEISTTGRKSFRKEDSSEIISIIKNRLHLLGDFSSTDTSAIYTSELEAAVQKMQERFGLTEDGIVGPQVIAALNVPVEDRIEQVLINMERMRWMPDFSEKKRIVVNIPEFKVRVYDGEKEALNMKIVVGKAATRTVIFSNRLKYIVFSPYWNVPLSIVRNEIVPAMEKDPNYLNRNNMEITGRENGLPVVRQKPGASNSLGLVKFLFPNQYNIYLHDTPAKSLFEKKNRAFSHGCIRINKPAELAWFLLKDNNNWSYEKIYREMHRSTEKWVTLPETVPVFITYLTAWVDNNGALNFRDDIYGHDKRMKSQMFLE